MVKKLLIVPLFLLSWSVFAGETIEVKVSGMYCEMCAYGLQLGLNGIEGVKTAKVDYSGQSCTIEMNDGEVVDIDAVRKLIIDSGFSPGEVTKIN